MWQYKQEAKPEKVPAPLFYFLPMEWRAGWGSSGSVQIWGLSHCQGIPEQKASVVFFF